MALAPKYPQISVFQRDAEAAILVSNGNTAHNRKLFITKKRNTPHNGLNLQPNLSYRIYLTSPIFNVIFFIRRIYRGIFI